MRPGSGLSTMRVATGSVVMTFAVFGSGKAIGSTCQIVSWSHLMHARAFFMRTSSPVPARACRGRALRRAERVGRGRVTILLGRGDAVAQPAPHGLLRA